MAKYTKTIMPAVVNDFNGIDVAYLFWELSAAQQAQFFNELSRHDRLVFQLQEVTECIHLSDQGRTAMAKIGEYSSRQ